MDDRVEALEPRILLAGDFFDAAAEARADFQLRLEFSADSVRLVDPEAGELVRSQPLDEISGRISIVGSAGDDRLTVDESVTLPVTFLGGDGHDTLVAMGERDNRWTIERQDGGHLNEQVEFSDVETLVGAADNEDTFVVLPGGNLTGAVDGADGGFDSLVFEGGSYGSFEFGADGL